MADVSRSVMLGGGGSEPSLPDRTPRRGGRWFDRRQVNDAFAFHHRTGRSWTDLAEHSGSWRGDLHGLRKWAVDETWGRSSQPCSPGRRRPRLARRRRLHDRSGSPARSRASGAPGRRAARPCAPGVIPRRTTHKDPPRRRRLRWPAFDRGACKRRNVVERSGTSSSSGADWPPARTRLPASTSPAPGPCHIHLIGEVIRNPVLRVLPAVWTPPRRSCRRHGGRCRSPKQVR